MMESDDAHRTHLQVAHKSTILVFTRDKFNTIARKLRSEFQKVLVSSEHKDCLNYLKTRTNENQDTKVGVDLVVADYDSSALRLIQYINERPAAVETSNCPLIPVIVILPADCNEIEARNHIRDCGDVTKILKQPIKSKDIFLNILHALFTVKKVEDTFAELRRQKVISSKYPYLPIFEGNTGKTEVFDSSSIVSGSKVLDQTSIRTANTTFTAQEHRIEEVDDATECSSLYPDYMVAAFDHHPELLSPFKQEKQRREASELAMERERQEKWRQKHVQMSSKMSLPSGKGKKITKNGARRSITRNVSNLSYEDDDLELGELSDEEEFSGRLQEGEEGEEEDKSEEDDLYEQQEKELIGDEDGNIVHGGNFVDKRLAESFDAIATEYAAVVADSLDESSAIVSRSNKPQLHELKKPKGKVHGSRCLELLDPSMRPTWNTASVRRRRTTTATTISDSKRKSRSGSVLARSTDIHPFVNKSKPLIQRPSTVGGLDKRYVDSYWRVISQNKIDYSAAVRRDNKGSRDSFELPRIEADDSSSMLISSPGKRSIFSQSGMRKHSSMRSANTMAPTAGDGRVDASASGSGKITLSLAEMERHNKQYMNSGGTSRLPSRRLSSGALSVSSYGTSNVGNQGTMSATRAEKKIQELALELPPDVQMSTVIDVELVNRKINNGERDMLEKGLRLEKEGELDNALILFQRAGTHSKDPQIGKILAGNLHYRNGKLMEALRQYTTATGMVQGRTDAPGVRHDEFVVYRNRAITYFRSGEDESGLRDMQHAVSLYPDNIETRQILSLAKRRMGRYQGAIHDAVLMTIQVNEEQRLKQMERSRQLNLQRLRQGVMASMINERKGMAGGSPSRKASASKIRRSSQSERRSQQHHADNNDGMSIKSNDSSRRGVSFRNDQIDYAIGVNDDAQQYQQHLLETRGYILEIEEPSCHNSLRERSKKSKRNIINDIEELDDQDVEGGYLKMFKMDNGFKNELFDDIFLKPSEIQNALLATPGHRQDEQVDIISTTLKLCPLLVGMSDSLVRDLANVVEYRAITTKLSLFDQNGPAQAVGILLSGQVQVKMLKRSSSAAALVDINIGDVPQYAAFGYIDCLFRNVNPKVMKLVDEIIRPRDESINAAVVPITGNAGATEQSQPLHNHVLSRDNSHNVLSTHPPGTSAATAGMSYATDGHLLKAAARDATDRKPSAALTEAVQGGGLDSGASLERDSYEPMLVLEDGTEGAPQHADRSLTSGMFKAYYTQPMTQLLMINQLEFERFLLPLALDELRVRMEVIRSSGVFNAWPVKHHVRLARMGLIRKVNRGDTILAQGAKPNYLYFILRGMCKVKKMPNRTEMLSQKLRAAREKAAKHDMKYVFDHKLRNELTPASAINTTMTTGAIGGGNGSPVPADGDSFAAISMDAAQQGDQPHGPAYLHSFHPKEPERIRYELELEIQKLEDLIAKASAQDEYDKDAVAHGKRPTSSNDLPWIEMKPAEICILRWPMLFGEACIIDPENGCSRGSIVAETSCELFMLHKTQIQTFPVDDAFITIIKERAAKYPDDPNIVVSLYREQGWKKYKESVMSGIRKDRWPSNDAQYYEAFRVV